jgi:hypothetical protein
MGRRTPAQNAAAASTREKTREAEAKAQRDLKSGVQRKLQWGGGLAPRSANGAPVRRPSCPIRLLRCSAEHVIAHECSLTRSRPIPGVSAAPSMAPAGAAAGPVEHDMTEEEARFDAAVIPYRELEDRRPGTFPLSHVPPLLRLRAVPLSGIVSRAVLHSVPTLLVRQPAVGLLATACIFASSRPELARFVCSAAQLNR